jgi:hypothetical protein
LDDNQKDQWRTAATTINKENPNKLTEIIRGVNQLDRRAQKEVAEAESRKR